MSYNYKNLKFGINLVEASLYELKFLDKIDKLHYLYNAKSINEALRRYELLWLPLMKSYEGTVVAPIDIYWVWHVHMLCPVTYRTDLQKKISKIIDHRFLPDDEYDTALYELEQKWHKIYPNESFYISEGLQNHRFESTFIYDIQTAAERQSSFFYQVSLPHYRSKEFLEKSLLRYKMFLTLKKVNPRETIAPCYDIDIIWHTHQVHPSVYARDTTSLLGGMLPHDDSVNDRRPDSMLTQFDKVTRCLWLTSFKESFSNDGCMFRGESTFGRLNDIDKAFLFFIRDKVIEFTVNIATNLTQKYKYIVRLYLTSHKAKDKYICKYDYETRNLKHIYEPFRFSTFDHNGFRVKLFRKTKLCAMKMRFCYCWSTHQDFDAFNPMTVGINYPYRIELLLNKKVFDNLTISFLSKSISPCEKFEGTVLVTEFLTISINVADPYLWGMTRVPNFESVLTEGIMATHRIETPKGKHVFDVNIIHSIKLSQSIVHIYSNERVLGIAHLIGREQLPLSDKVHSESKYPFLNNKEGQRAMIIKDNRGDWAIIIANWRVNNDIRIPYSGTDIEIFFLRDNNRCLHLEIGSIENLHFIVDDLFVNIKNGQLELRPCGDIEYLPNYVCLSFTISVLFILCKPKSIAVKEFHANCEVSLHTDHNLHLTPEIKVIGKPYVHKQIGPSNNNVNKKHYDLSEALLLKAVGYNYDLYIPSNSFFKQCVDSGGCAGCVGYSNELPVKKSKSMGDLVYRENSRIDDLSMFCSEHGDDNESQEWN